MNIIYRAAYHLAASSGGNPAISTVVVMLFYLMFNTVEAVIEELIWGERFVHWLDPVFMLGFIAFAAYQVYICAVYNAHQKTRQEEAQQ
jgi:uncharacterized membrane protein